MSYFDNGGPAFPVHPELASKVRGVFSHYDCGMSLRDWFAGMAMQSLLTAYSNTGDDAVLIENDECETIAVVAYEMADAMIGQWSK
jgi:hypothetical protein